MKRNSEKIEAQHQSALNEALDKRLKNESLDKSKRRKISPEKRNTDSQCNKSQSHLNYTNPSPSIKGFQREISSTHLSHRGHTNNLNATFPSASNTEVSGCQSWDPLWGQQGPWFTSRSNLNFCNFDTKSVPAPSNSNPTSPRNQLSCNNQFQRFSVEPSAFLSLEETFKSINQFELYSKNLTNKFEKLSKEIWSHFARHQQHGKIFRQKIKLWNELERVLRLRFRCTTHVFGSTLNGFGSSESDMDLCMFNGKIISKKGQNEVRLLADVRRAIR